MALFRLSRPSPSRILPSETCQRWLVVSPSVEVVAGLVCLVVATSVAGHNAIASC